jgi:hypothetical protein
MLTNEQEKTMQAYLEARLSIADLMTGWIYRDLGEWDRLRGLFHPDATIEITWFEGKATDFIDASMRMGASDLRTKHVVASPVVSFNGNKAVVETNAIIVGENVSLGVGCNQHSRFYDLVEKRDGAWKLVRRQCIYDMGAFTYPRGVIELDAGAIERHPREYASLAYLLEKSGFPVTRVFATKGSEQEAAMKSAARAWLGD